MEFLKKWGGKMDVDNLAVRNLKNMNMIKFLPKIRTQNKHPEINRPQNRRKKKKQKQKKNYTESLKKS